MPKYRKMLNEWDAPYIQALVKVIETQSTQTLTAWTVDYAESVLLPIWNKHCPSDLRPKSALSAARAWLNGEAKPAQVKPAVKECDTAAREMEANPTAQAAARGIGQCAGTVYTATHAIGLALYGALAVAYDTLGIDAAWPQFEQRAGEECERMLAALQAVAVPDEPNPAKISWKC